jgi:hypothetical protein
VGHGPWALDPTGGGCERSGRQWEGRREGAEGRLERCNCAMWMRRYMHAGGVHETARGPLTVVGTMMVTVMVMADDGDGSSSSNTNNDNSKKT